MHACMHALVMTKENEAILLDATVFGPSQYTSCRRATAAGIHQQDQQTGLRASRSRVSSHYYQAPATQAPIKIWSKRVLSTVAVDNEGFFMG